jgi:hypothetical protein
VAFKVSAVQELCEDILLKGGYGAAVKTKPEFKGRQEIPGNHHIADTEGRRDCAGEGVQVEHIPAF